MGCDIHMYCEKLVKINKVEKWVNADNWKLNSWYDKNDPSEPEYNIQELHGDRDYSMFTALCGVRDYTNKSPKISEPRGIPDDCSEVIKKASIEWDSDGHSHSYVTLKEVREFVENPKPIKYSGLISKKQASELDHIGQTPNSWCQGSNRDDLVFREWECSDCMPLNSLYAVMKDRADGYLFDIKEDNFRIVFWFDN